MAGAVNVLSLTPRARIKSLIVVNCILDLSAVLTYKRANDDNSDDFCSVNKLIFVDIYKVFIHCHFVKLESQRPAGFVI